MVGHPRRVPTNFLFTPFHPFFFTMSEDAEVLKIFVSTGESWVPRICLKAVKKRKSPDPVSAADFVKFVF